MSAITALIPRFDEHHALESRRVLLSVSQSSSTPPVLEMTRTQLQLVIDLAVLESVPLLALEEYWKQRHRERFSLWNLALSSLMFQDKLQDRLEQVRKELRNVHRTIGVCESHLAAMHRSERLNDIKSLQSVMSDAQHFIDSSVLKSEVPLSEQDRLHRLMHLRDGQVAVGEDRIKELQEAMPLWDQLQPFTKAMVWAGLGLSAYALGLYALQPASSTRQLVNETDASSTEQQVATSTSTTSSMAEVESLNARSAKETIGVVYNNADTWFSSGKEWILEHIYRPTRSMTEQMFLNGKGQSKARMKEHELAVQDAKESLQNMIREHASRSQQDEALVLQKAKALDMTTISRDYEKKIQTPIKSAVVDNLVELLLIQGQFLKLQLLDGMLQIDKLLEENRFNSQLVVLAPSLIVVGALYNGFKAVYYKLVDDSKSKSRSHLNLRKLVVSLSVALTRLSELQLGREQDEAVEDVAGGTHIQDDKVLVGEGHVTQLTLRIRSMLESNLSAEAFRLYDQLLENILKRQGVTVKARLRFSSQLLYLVCSQRF